MQAIISHLFALVIWHSITVRSFLKASKTPPYPSDQFFQNKERIASWEEFSRIDVRGEPRFCAKNNIRVGMAHKITSPQNSLNFP